MEFIKANYLQTSTQITVNSNTLAAEYLIIRDPIFQWQSSGLNNDLTTASITIAFDMTMQVSRIILKNINAKSFNIFYDGATANTFAFTSTSATTTSQFSNNSETSMYFYCTPVDCTSVTLDLKSTQVADSEKVLGQIVLSDLRLDFERIPSAKNYKPNLNAEQIEHKLSDGGVRLHTVSNKFDTTISYKYITESFRDDLLAVFQEQLPIVFAPFGTSTGWDGVAYEAVWVGDFDFYVYSDDAPNAGYSGRIRLKETS